MDDMGKIEDNILEQVYKVNSGYLMSNQVTKAGRKQAEMNAKNLNLSNLEHGEIMVFLKQNIKGK